VPRPTGRRGGRHQPGARQLLPSRHAGSGLTKQRQRRRQGAAQPTPADHQPQVHQVPRRVWLGRVQRPSIRSYGLTRWSTRWPSMVCSLRPLYATEPGRSSMGLGPVAGLPTRGVRTAPSAKRRPGQLQASNPRSSWESLSGTAGQPCGGISPRVRWNPRQPEPAAQHPLSIPRATRTQKARVSRNQCVSGGRR